MNLENGTPEQDWLVTRAEGCIQEHFLVRPLLIVIRGFDLKLTKTHERLEQLENELAARSQYL